MRNTQERKKKLILMILSLYLYQRIKAFKTNLLFGHKSFGVLNTNPLAEHPASCDNTFEETWCRNIGLRSVFCRLT